jgi:hypothetical protein
VLPIPFLKVADLIQVGERIRNEKSERKILGENGELCV